MLLEFFGRDLFLYICCILVEITGPDTIMILRMTNSSYNKILSEQCIRDRLLAHCSEQSILVDVKTVMKFFTGFGYSDHFFVQAFYTTKEGENGIIAMKKTPEEFEFGFTKDYSIHIGSEECACFGSPVTDNFCFIVYTYKTTDKNEARDKLRELVENGTRLYSFVTYHRDIYELDILHITDKKQISESDFAKTISSDHVLLIKANNGTVPITVLNPLVNTIGCTIYWCEFLQKYLIFEDKSIEYHPYFLNEERCIK